MNISKTLFQCYLSPELDGFEVPLSAWCCPGVGVLKHSLRREDPSNKGHGGVSINISLT